MMDSQIFSHIMSSRIFFVVVMYRVVLQLLRSNSVIRGRVGLRVVPFCSKAVYLHLLRFVP